MSSWHDPTAVFTLCVTFCALIFWSERQRWARGFYKVVPPIVLVCYVPATASALGILPYQSPVYAWMGNYLLPLSLFLLMVTADVRAVLKVGRVALGVMLFGTVGVIVGAPVALLIGQSWLPADGWTAIAAVAGGWIGGPVNFAALLKAVDVPESLVGPALIVDTAIAFTWLSLLLWLANYQGVLNRWLGIEVREDDVPTDTIAGSDTVTLQRPPDVADILVLGALGLGGVLLCTQVADWLADALSPALNALLPGFGDIFSGYTWLIILVTTLGILLSLTPLRRIEEAGAPDFGYAVLYVFLASLGAQADLSGIVAAPGLLAVGVIWLAIHIVFVLIGAKLLKAPVALAAIGSMANIGGAVSTPVLAAAYARTLMPVGLLLAVFCNVIGTYAALLCAYLLKLVAGA